MAKAKGSNAVHAVAVPDREYHSVSVRKIDNGYIISKSSEGPKGYRSSESLSPTKPKIELPAAKPMARGRR
jgi:hypothetical protein